MRRYTTVRYALNFWMRQIRCYMLTVRTKVRKLTAIFPKTAKTKYAKEAIEDIL